MTFNPTLRFVAPLVLFAGLSLAQTQPVMPQPGAKVAVRRTQPRRQPDAEPMKISGTIERIVVGDRVMPLPETARKALELSRQRADEAEPEIGKDGRILYRYGHGTPIVPCSPNSLTTIEFASGEKLNGEHPWQIGDESEWSVEPHSTVLNNELHSYVLLKPNRLGAPTDLVVFTDRHMYPIKLLSTNEGHLLRVGFVDTEYEEAQKVKAFEAAQAADRAHAAEETRKADEVKAKDKSLAAADTFGAIRNSDYEKKPGKHAAYMVPVVVYDDGAHTFIRLAEGARHRDIPALKIVGPTGPDIPGQKFDADTLTYTVDGVFKGAELVTGSKRHMLKVTITNRGLND